jgi:hypothetical protein
MSDASIISPRTISIGHRTRLLCVGLLLVLSAISVSSTPAPAKVQSKKTASLPKTYCAADVASLGTGLARAAIISGEKSPSQKMRRWTGWVRAAASGKYEFSLPNSNGRIVVNQQQIYARSGGSSKPAVIQIAFLTNRYYAITVEAPDTGNSTLPLQWKRPDGRQENVPKAYLYAPVATAGNRET